MRLTCTVVLAVTLSASPTFAQGTGATLQGVVRDGQGGVLPGTTVVVTNTDTGIPRSMVADEQGFYRAAALPPGRYAMEAHLSGFVRYTRTGVTLTIGEEAVVNVEVRVEDRLHD